MSSRLVGLNVYPLKSARGIALTRARLTATGIAHDREWLLVDEHDRFLTQREAPRLATLEASPFGRASLALRAPALRRFTASAAVRDAHQRTVRIWSDECRALDAGDAAARRLSEWLQRPCRLVRFHPATRRASARQWTGDIEALNQFNDGFPLLLLNLASLRDLNARLGHKLPADRFRANLIVDGLPAYGEDSLREFRIGAVLLRAVKPCTRCIITTTDQSTGERAGEEPLKLLKSYRYDAALHGVTFCQNVVIVRASGGILQCGAPVLAPGRRAR